MKHLLLPLVLTMLMLSCTSTNEERKLSESYDLNPYKGITATNISEHVAFTSIEIGDCQWTEGFWAEQWKHAEQTMIPYMGTLLKGDTGHGYNNFKIAADLKEGEHKGFWWHDGDFYKWMEAQTYLYGVNKSDKIKSELDEIIAVIAKAQQTNGYLSTPIIIRDSLEPFTNRRYHELYNSGHLLTAATIHYRVTGQRNFLDIAVKHADYLYDLFVPIADDYKKFGFNQTQIMGLVELYRTTDDVRYLELAEQFINLRGTYKVEEDSTTKGYPIGDMVQERIPLRQAEEAVGHAVLALYFYAGAADVLAETGKAELLEALNRLWENVSLKKMYITGAVGQAHYGRSSNRDNIEEGFIDEFMMPNLTAYNETCANICNAMFNYRMLGINGEAKHANIMELVLHNSMLSGIGLSGKEYYYSNPLRKLDGALDYDKMNTEFEQRQPYLDCFCCPPNLVRTIAKSPGWAYSKTKNGIAVNLYGGNVLKTKLKDGSSLRMTQKSNFPWEGSVEECKDSAFDVALRIPDWAVGAQVQINGEEAYVVEVNNYHMLSREWEPGDQIKLELPMDIKLMEGHPRIEETRNQVALKRGPIVYCLETADLPEGASITDVYLDANESLTPVFEPETLGGVVSLQGTLLLRKHKKEPKMYNEVDTPEFQKIRSKLIPYYTWSNRGHGEMTVFLPVVW